MAATIEVVPFGTLVTAVAVEMVVIKIGDEPAMIVPDAKQASTIAFWLNAAREAKSEHSAMHILTEKLYLSEVWAKRMLGMLNNPSNQEGEEANNEYPFTFN
jgi:hypothetical protein